MAYENSVTRPAYNPWEFGTNKRLADEADAYNTELNKRKLAQEADDAALRRLKVEAAQTAQPGTLDKSTAENMLAKNAVDDVSITANTDSADRLTKSANAENELFYKTFGHINNAIEAGDTKTASDHLAQLAAAAQKVPKLADFMRRKGFDPDALGATMAPGYQNPNLEEALNRIPSLFEAARDSDTKRFNTSATAASRDRRTDQQAETKAQELEAKLKMMGDKISSAERMQAQKLIATYRTEEMKALMKANTAADRTNKIAAAAKVLNLNQLTTQYANDYILKNNLKGPDAVEFLVTIGQAVAAGSAVTNANLPSSIMGTPTQPQPFSLNRPRAPTTPGINPTPGVVTATPRAARNGQPPSELESLMQQYIKK